MSMQSVNPANGQFLRGYEEYSSSQVNDILESLKGTFDVWSHTDFKERNRFAARLAELLEERKERYGRLITEEMGKPIEQAVAEIEKCASLCRYYEENAHGFLQPYEIETKHHLSEVYYAPLGVVLAVMPWNFPFWQVVRASVPAIMAGNVVALKHASNVTGCGLALEELFLNAVGDKKVLRSLLVSGSKVEEVIKHPAVAGVTLTGSTATGKKVASIAGGQIKKQVLELGGSDPYLILEDADIEKAAKACAQGRFGNTGQSCISAKRLLVHRQIKEKFEEAFLRQIETYQMADPLSPETKLGPMARKDLRDDLHKQVTQSLDEGAKLVVGGKIPKKEGFWYPATLLTDVTPDMTVAREEVFGPVGVIIPVESEDQAVAIANDTRYGLGAAVFTRDEARGMALAHRLHAGSVFINTLVKSDPRLPFGGIRESGFGREMSAEGIREFTNVKTLVISR